MTDHVPSAELVRALALSDELLGAADRGDMAALTLLDAQRLQLLKSYRAAATRIDPVDRVALGRISQLNERAIGLMEHQRRIKARAFELVAVGRRAVAAYASNG